MKPKDKAKQLFDKFLKVVPLVGYQDWGGGGGADYNKQKKQAKQCALIAVDQVLAFIGEENWSDPSWEYWQEVKEEIEKL